MFASKDEQNNVNRFLVAEEFGVPEMQRRMKTVYVEHDLSMTPVRDCQERFFERRKSVNNDSYT